MNYYHLKYYNSLSILIKDIEEYHNNKTQYKTLKSNDSLFHYII